MDCSWVTLDRREARLLGRNGQPLAVPVSVTEREVLGRPGVAADLNAGAALRRRLRDRTDRWGRRSRLEKPVHRDSGGAMKSRRRSWRGRPRSARSRSAPRCLYGATDPAASGLSGRRQLRAGRRRTPAAARSDRRGPHRRGLSVLEDGKPQKIEAFEFVRVEASSRSPTGRIPTASAKSWSPRRSAQPRASWSFWTSRT